MEFGLSEREKDEAVRYLMGRSGRKTLEKVWLRMQEEGPFWHLGIRQELMAWVANALMEGGFNWDLISIHDMGIDLIEEAARRLHDAAAPSELGSPLS